MSYSVYVRGSAERDVVDGQRWYELQQAGLAAEFNAEFGAALTRLSQTPFLCPQKYRGIRRAVLHRFPFLVWYRVKAGRITVRGPVEASYEPAPSAVLRQDEA